jgi:hypothetical protein
LRVGADERPLRGSVRAGYVVGDGDADAVVERIFLKTGAEVQDVLPKILSL